MPHSGCAQVFSTRSQKILASRRFLQTAIKNINKYIWIPSLRIGEHSADQPYAVFTPLYGTVLARTANASTVQKASNELPDANRMRIRVDTAAPTSALIQNDFSAYYRHKDPNARHRLSAGTAAMNCFEFLLLMLHKIGYLSESTLTNFANANAQTIETFMNSLKTESQNEPTHLYFETNPLRLEHKSRLTDGRYLHKYHTTYDAYIVLMYDTSSQAMHFGLYEPIMKTIISLDNAPRGNHFFSRVTRIPLEQVCLNKQTESGWGHVNFKFVSVDVFVNRIQQTFFGGSTRNNGNFNELPPYFDGHWNDPVQSDDAQPFIPPAFTLPPPPSSAYSESDYSGSPLSPRFHDDPFAFQDEPVGEECFNSDSENAG